MAQILSCCSGGRLYKKALCPQRFSEFGAMCIWVGWCNDDVLDGFLRILRLLLLVMVVRCCKDIERNKQCCCFCSCLWTSSLAVHEYHQSINEEMGHGCLSGMDSQEDVAEVSVPRLSDLVLFDSWDKHSDSEHFLNLHSCFVSPYCRGIPGVSWCHDTQTTRD